MDTAKTMLGKSSRELLYYLHLEKRLNTLRETDIGDMFEDDLLDMMDYIWWKLDQHERDWITSKDLGTMERNKQSPNS